MPVRPTRHCQDRVADTPPTVYHGQSVVKMWVFSKNTIAGDLGVTPIIQCLASMLITSTLVHSDLHHSAIKPLPYVYPHVDHLPDPRLLLSPSYRRQQRDQPSHPTPLEPVSSDRTIDREKKQQSRSGTTEKRGFSYYYWMLIRFIFEGTERNMLLAKPGFGNWFGRFIWTAAQGAGIGIIFGFPIWCLAVLILGPIYGNGNLGNQWAPQVIKLVYGAIVGWVTNPVIAILALGSQADHHLILVEDEKSSGDEERDVGADGHGLEGARAVGVPTIHEEGEASGDTLVPPGTPRLAPASPRSSPNTRTSVLATPFSQRARASSNASFSSRPPLTANASGLSPLPPTHMPLSSPGEVVERPAYGRERGMTVSSVGSGFSYALGGTAGRAQRPRATTAASTSGLPVARQPIPDVTVSQADGQNDVEDVPGRSRAGSWDVFGRRVTAPTGVPTLATGSPETGTRPRSASTLAALGEVKGK